MLKRNMRGKNKLNTFIKQNDNNERENINQSYFFLQTSLFSFRQGGNTNQHLKEVFVNPNKCGNAQCSRPLLLLDGKYYLPECVKWLLDQIRHGSPKHSSLIRRITLICPDRGSYLTHSCCTSPLVWDSKRESVRLSLYHGVYLDRVLLLFILHLSRKESKEDHGGFNWNSCQYVSSTVARP